MVHWLNSNRSKSVWLASSNGRIHYDISEIESVCNLLLSETRSSEQDQLEELGSGYTFFWNGRTKSERRDTGVAVAIWNDIVGRLPCLLQGMNDRLMSLRLPLRGDKFATSSAPPLPQ
ncbi:unnamed protein product [Schistocephalus solidus]|uniref:Uncharacterized protein n=1 Tax=Schistocephalus solidus TaxID=70667 RepID=A0A183SVW3_SCHSO|nr:unnamed protein product [Schistocephalus solidus]